MAWCWLGAKSLSEPMMAQLTDVYVSLGLNELKERGRKQELHNTHKANILYKMVPEFHM